MTDEQLHPQTRAVMLGRPEREPGGPVSPPLNLSSTFHADGDLAYGRVGNPTWSALEEVLGDLEGGAALTFASGMAAISAVVEQVPVGGVVVAPTHAYNTTTALLRRLADAGRLVLRQVDVTGTAEVLGACHGADLLLLESPTNPMMEVADLPAIVSGLGPTGPVLACDNTFATPIHQRPIELGADVVVHSVTKFLAGHSDVLLGAVVTAPTDRGRRWHEQLADHRLTRGAIPGPSESWLALRGIRTLALRMEHAGQSARTIAERLADHPAVERVRYPGFGAMLAIEVAGGEQAAEQVCRAVRLWTHATSLGGVESLIERRRRHELEVVTVPRNLLRLSVGIEHVDDLWDDLARALG